MRYRAKADIFSGIERVERFTETTLGEKDAFKIPLDMIDFKFYEKVSKDKKEGETGIEMRIAVRTDIKKSIYDIIHEHNRGKEKNSITIQEEIKSQTDDEILRSLLKKPEEAELYSMVLIKGEVNFGKFGKRKELDAISYLSTDGKQGIAVTRQERKEPIEQDFISIH